MKIKIIEKENVKEVEISLGLSSKGKDMLKAFTKKTKNAVVNAGTQVVKKVNNFVDEIVEEETREAREYVAEVVKEAKEDAQRIVDEARERYFASTKKQFDETDENDEKVENNLEEKISKIPEGKIFTLAEYLDYTEEYKCIGTMQSYHDMAREFLHKINFPCTNKTVEVFVQMLKLDRPSYQKIDEEMFCGDGVGIEIARCDFGIWLVRRPDVKKYCPKANLWQLLSYFKKKVKEAENN